MELVVRMRALEEKKIPYRVSFVTGPSFWTEVRRKRRSFPTNVTLDQRIQLKTLQLHQKFGLNPAFTALWICILSLLVHCWKNGSYIRGLLDYLHSVLIAMEISAHFYFYSPCFSWVSADDSSFLSFSILYEQIAFNNYKDKKGLKIVLILTILIEPFLVHSKDRWWGLSGPLATLSKANKGAGEDVQMGFKKFLRTKRILNSKLLYFMRNRDYS